MAAPLDQQSGCLGALFRPLRRLRKGRAPAPEASPNAGNQLPATLTASGKAMVMPERLPLYRVLVEVAGDRAAVWVNVRLEEVVQTSDWNGWEDTRIDFLLCDPRDARPLVAVLVQSEETTGSDRQAAVRLLKAAGIEPVMLACELHCQSHHELAALVLPRVLARRGRA